MDEKYKVQKKKKKFQINIKNMGIDIDKNEYKERYVTKSSSFNMNCFFIK